MIMKRFFAVCLIILGFGYGCAHQPKITAPVKSDPLQQIADWMTGSFSSKNQAESDGDYMDIRLHMVRIWKDRVDGYWLYVEQAVRGKDPYRQRIYHVTSPEPDLFRSSVFEFEKPEKFKGGWETPEKFDTLAFEQLDLREGCDIYLRKHGDSAFYGSSIGRECVSTLHDARYASAEIELRQDRMITWDRGFNEKGKQVWGAEKGGYIFDKIEDYPL